jgi:hypothetical protein
VTGLDVAVVVADADVVVVVVVVVVVRALSGGDIPFTSQSQYCSPAQSVEGYCIALVVYVDATVEI